MILLCTYVIIQHRKMINFIKLKSIIRIGTCWCIHAAALFIVVLEWLCPKFKLNSKSLKMHLKSVENKKKRLLLPPSLNSAKTPSPPGHPGRPPSLPWPNQPNAAPQQSSRSLAHLAPCSAAASQYGWVYKEYNQVYIAGSDYS